jgi:hypothetical protein
MAVAVPGNASDTPVNDLGAAFVRLIGLAESGPRRSERRDLAAFTGRFKDDYEITDIATLEGCLYGMDPTQVDPTATAIRLDRVDDITLLMTGGNAIGETYDYTFANDGEVEESGVTAAS